MNNLRFRDLNTGRLAFRGLAALVRARKPRVVYLDVDPWGYPPAPGVIEITTAFRDDQIAALFGAIAASCCRVVLRTAHPERAVEWFGRVDGLAQRGASWLSDPRRPGADMRWLYFRESLIRLLRVDARAIDVAWPLPSLALAAIVRTRSDVARLAIRPPCAAWAAWVEAEEDVDLSGVCGLDWVVLSIHSDKRRYGAMWTRHVGVMASCIVGRVPCFWRKPAVGHLPAAWRDRA